MFDWDNVGRVDQVGFVFEKRDDEQVAVIGVHFSHVDRRFELDLSDALLGLEVPENGSPVLRGCEQVSATSRPAGDRQTWSQKETGCRNVLEAELQHRGREIETAYLRLCICLKCPCSFIATPIVSISLGLSAFVVTT